MKHLMTQISEKMKMPQTLNNERGAIGWILLWAIGIPVPLLVLLFILRGGT